MLESTAMQASCPRCGHVVSGAKFCDQCGQSLARVATSNPYAAPTIELGEVSAEPQLASRGARLGASIIDAVAVAFVNLPLLGGAGLIPFSRASPGPVELIPVVVISFLGFAAVQGWFLARGQTIGKFLLGMRIVDVESGESPGVAHLLGLRYLPTSALTIFGPIGSLFALLDVVLVFGKQRRCLHDFIASTRVVWDDPSHRGRDRRGP